MLVESLLIPKKTMKKQTIRIKRCSCGSPAHVKFTWRASNSSYTFHKVYQVYCTNCSFTEADTLKEAVRQWNEYSKSDEYDTFVKVKDNWIREDKV